MVLFDVYGSFYFREDQLFMGGPGSIPCGALVLVRTDNNIGRAHGDNTGFVALIPLLGSIVDGDCTLTNC